MEFVIHVKEGYCSSFLLYLVNILQYKRSVLSNIMELIKMADVRWLKSSLIIFFSQLVVIGLFSFFFYFTQDKIIVNSVILGGLIYCVPALFACVFMSRASDKSAMLVLFKAYLGSIYKIGITIILFIYVFKNIPINVSVFFSAYAIIFVTQCVMSFVIHKSH